MSTLNKETNGPWSLTDTTSKAGTVTYNFDTAGTFVDRNIGLSVTTPEGSLSAGSGTSDAIGTNISLGAKTTTQPASSSSYITVTGSGTVSVETGGWITQNTSKTSDIETAYYPIAQCLPTIDQDLPSGVTSAGTITTGKYIKIPQGYNLQDKYYLADGAATEGYAAIYVIYPAGQVCTCTSGSVTLSAKDTSGRFIFSIPNKGIWDIKLDGIQQEQVEITYEGQVVTIVLAELALFDMGEQYSDITGGWIGYKGNYENNNYSMANGYMDITSAKGKPPALYTTGRAIDLTPYTTLHALAYSNSHGNSDIGIVKNPITSNPTQSWARSNYISYVEIASHSPWTEYTLQLPVDRTNINIAVVPYGGSNGNPECYVQKIWVT